MSRYFIRSAPNNVKTSYQHDGLDRLTRITSTKGTTTITDFQYQFSDANNIAQIADAAGANSYGYDALDSTVARLSASKTTLATI